MRGDTIFTAKGYLKNKFSDTDKEIYIYQIKVSKNNFCFDNNPPLLITAVLKLGNKRLAKISGSLSGKDDEELQDDFNRLGGKVKYIFNTLQKNKTRWAEIEAVLGMKCYQLFILDNAFVEPEYRNRGLFKALFSQLFCTLCGVYEYCGMVVALASGRPTYTKQQLDELDNIFDGLTFEKVKSRHRNRKTGKVDGAVFINLFDYCIGAEDQWDQCWDDKFEDLDIDEKYIHY